MQEQNRVAGAGNGLEIVKRNREGKSFYFVMNFRDEELEIPEEFAGQNRSAEWECSRKRRKTSEVWCEDCSGIKI